MILYIQIICNAIQCVRKFSDDNRTKLLIFATGNSQVPVTGFKDLQGNGEIQHFKLKKSGLENDLPKSHTWYVYYFFYISINFFFKKIINNYKLLI